MKNLNNYIDHLYRIGFNLSPLYWVVIILAFIVLLYLLSLIYRLLLNEDSVIYKLKKSIILSLFSVEIIFIGLVFYLFVFKYNNIIAKQNIELDLIVISISSVLITTLFVLLIQQSIKLDTRSHLPIYLSNKEKGRLIYELNSNYSRFKLFSLIVFIPFIILVFAINRQQKASISLFIDNSGSTSSYIDYGKNLLINATKNIEYDTKFIITNFSDNDEVQSPKPNKTSLSKILEDKDNIKKLCESVVLDNSISAYEFIESYQLPVCQQGSPILQCVWENFKISQKEIIDNRTNILILITDGLGNYTDLLEESFFDIVDSESGVSMNDFYDHISIINIGEDTESKMFEYANPNYIFNGFDESSYKQALLSTTVAIQKKNWMFVFIITFFIIISSAIILATNVKPKLNIK